MVTKTEQSDEFTKIGAAEAESLVRSQTVPARAQRRNRFNVRQMNTQRFTKKAYNAESGVEEYRRLPVHQKARGSI